MMTDFAERMANEAYDELTPAQKKVWNLCKRQGLSAQVAADRLFISRKAVERRLVWAEKKFKKHLEQIKDQHGN